MERVLSSLVSPCTFLEVTIWATSGVSWPQLSSVVHMQSLCVGVEPCRASFSLFLTGASGGHRLRPCPGEGTLAQPEQTLGRLTSCIVLPLFQIPSGDTCLRNPLHKQQSLPLRPIIPLVARISDQNASGAPPMTVREKTRLEKFRQLLSSHNTDLGAFTRALDEVALWCCGDYGPQRSHIYCLNFFYF
jgi:hypothetical protein